MGVNRNEMNGFGSQKYLKREIYRQPPRIQTDQTPERNHNDAKFEIYAMQAQALHSARGLIFGWWVEQCFISLKSARGFSRTQRIQASIYLVQRNQY